MRQSVRIYSALQLVCLLIGGVCLIAGLAGYFLQPEDSARVVVDTAPLENIQARPEQHLELSFTIRNPTRHAARVVGLTTC